MILINYNNKNKKRKNENDITTPTTTTEMTPNNALNSQPTQPTQTPTTTTNQTGYNYPTQSNNIENTETYKILQNAYLNSQSNLNQQNQLANKYAHTTAQAQGFSTQGAREQLWSTLQNAYLNAQSNENVNYQNLLANLQNDTSNQALSNLQNELNSMQNFDEEEIQKMIDLYMPRMNKEDQEYAKYKIEQLGTNNYEGEVVLNGKKLDFNYIPKNFGYDKTAAPGKIDTAIKELEYVFGKDIANQSFGNSKTIEKKFELFYKFAQTLKNNPQSLEGKYFNMNYGAGKVKLYRVKNGRLEKVKSTNGAPVINIKNFK